MNISIRRFVVIGLLSAVMAGLMAGSALAATPTPTTNAAIGVGVSTATLNGLIQTRWCRDAVAVPVRDEHVIREDHDRQHHSSRRDQRRSYRRSITGLNGQ